MNKRKTAALVILFSTILAGTYTAVRVGAPVIPPVIVGTDTPTVTPTYAGCAYMWAYRDLPEVSAQFDLAIKEEFPQAGGWAQAFGEDCVYADGQAEFGASETDFYVNLPVEDLADEEALGDRMAAIMTTVIDRFPRETLPGGQDGFVEFRFEMSETDFLILRVPILKYKNEAAGKTGTELFSMFYQIP